ncbi:MAG: hypothetical protein EOP49_52495 [Sphingobacteriales bacterium]|nr:MAG: hypothetical protein EOP49_52495 [Sphingobacteriales bacterium]
MMTTAVEGTVSGDQIDWSLPLPTLAAGSYELRVAAYDQASTAGNTEVVPFKVVSSVNEGLPINVALTPAKVKVAAGKAVAFKATYKHSLSYTNLKFLYFRAQIGDEETTTKIWARYDVKAKVVSIYNTATSRWVNGYAPGTKVTVTSNIADLNVRQCKLTLPKGKNAATQAVAFTFSIIPKVSGVYTTAIQCSTDNVSSEWQDKGTLTVTAGKSGRTSSIEPSAPTS